MAGVESGHPFESHPRTQTYSVEGVLMATCALLNGEIVRAVRETVTDGIDRGIPGRIAQTVALHTLANASASLKSRLCAIFWIISLDRQVNVMGDPRDASVATVVGRFLLFVPAEVTAPWCAAAGSRCSAKSAPPFCLRLLGRSLMAI